MLGAVDADDLGEAVGVARVVDEASRRAVERRVDHQVLVDAEHVAADALQKHVTSARRCDNLSKYVVCRGDLWG